MHSANLEKSQNIKCSYLTRWEIERTSGVTTIIIGEYSGRSKYTRHSLDHDGHHGRSHHYRLQDLVSSIWISCRVILRGSLLQCGGTVKLIGEQRNGLASILSSTYTQCGDCIPLETSRKVKGPNGYKCWESNLATLWGQMSTGNGHNNLQDAMSGLGVPVMSKTTFIQTERDIGELWEREMEKAMLEAGKEEKRLVEEARLSPGT